MRAEFSITLSARSAAVRIALLYFAGSAAWVVLSDSILHGVIRGAPPVLWQLETVKGLIFVFVSAGIVGAAVYRCQRQQEKARLVTESKLRKLRESGLIGIFGYDETGTVKQANDAFLRIIGYTKEELCKDEIVLAQLTPVEYVHRNAVADRKIATRGFSPIYEQELLRKDGARIPVIGGRASADSKGDYGIGYMLDISGLKKAEEEKDALHAQLLQSEKLNAVGQLAAGVAHDFNNLLNIIIWYCSLAQTTAESPAAVRNNTDHAIKAATDATVLIRQLLAFGRKQNFHNSTLELNALIEGHCQMLQRLVGEQIMICFSPGPPAWIAGDGIQLQQVLMNLVTNARDAMEHDGTIEISTAHRTLGAEVQDVPSGDYVMLKVSDTGKGMDAGVLGRIFDPFFTTKEPHRGTGLGLSTTYGIIKQSNGHISVDSVPNQGTTFTILLPLLEEAATRPKLIKGVRQRTVVTGTILVVEDSIELQELFVSVLERAGFHVLRASSGVEAVNVADRFGDKIDLVISDIVMPRLNGPEAVNQLVERRPQLKVIFVSGYADAAKLTSRWVVLQKPVAPDALIEMVHQTLAA